MNYKRIEPDVSLVLKSLESTGIIVEPIQKKGHTCLTDEDGNQTYIDENFNLFVDFNDFIIPQTISEMSYSLNNYFREIENNREKYFHKKLTSENYERVTYFSGVA